MARVNYVKECRAFLRFSCGRGLTGNEVVLWHALFELMNQQAREGDWPEGFVPLSNALVLSHTTFGSGDSACETLRRARERLSCQGLIRYRRGRRQSAPPYYRMVYFEAETPCAPGDAGTAPEMPERASGDGFLRAQNGSDGNAIPDSPDGRGGDLLAKPLGTSLGSPLGNPLDIPINLNVNPNANPVTHTHFPKGDSHPAGAALPGEPPPGGGKGRGEGPAAGPRKAGGGPSADPAAPVPVALRGASTAHETLPPGGETFDSAWKTSARARGAVAQRLIERYDGLMDAPDAWGDLCELMEGGMPPGTILREMPTRRCMSRVIARLRALALCGTG